MLRNNPAGSVLVTVFFLLALLSCWLSVRWYFSIKNLQDMELRYQATLATKQAAERLMLETVEYSKRNPDIDRILYQFRMKAPPAAPATPPAARPSR